MWVSEALRYRARIGLQLSRFCFCFSIFHFEASGMLIGYCPFVGHRSSQCRYGRKKWPFASFIPVMNHNEETKTLLPAEDNSNVTGRAIWGKWMHKVVSSKTVYLICLSFLVLNIALLTASWHIHTEIKSLYSSYGRDIESLPRPDPFAGLSEARESKHAGEEPRPLFASETLIWDSPPQLLRQNHDVANLPFISWEFILFCCQ